MGLAFFIIIEKHLKFRLFDLLAFPKLLAFSQNGTKVIFQVKSNGFLNIIMIYLHLVCLNQFTLLEFNIVWGTGICDLNE